VESFDGKSAGNPLYVHVLPGVVKDWIITHSEFFAIQIPLFNGNKKP
jgi:hypothetical protein